jgi:hypothetical protein
LIDEFFAVGKRDRDVLSLLPPNGISGQDEEERYDSGASQAGNSPSTSGGLFSWFFV